MNILFLCVGNSARSQMAEGLAKNMLGDNFNIKSAGSQPSGEVHKNAIWAMNEIGIDISNQQSKAIDDIENEFMENLNYVITLCSEEICPVINNDAKKLNWINEDPANINFSDLQSKNSFIKVRNNLYSLIKKFYLLNT
jgi:arsenate reductase